MTLDEPRRPDPDALLLEAAKAGRGRLKVFLGTAPGVGKTYEMLAQPFAKDEYLHPRPSAAGSNGYDPTGSSGSNYGPLSPDLAKRVAGDAAALRKSTGSQVIPDDAITTSGSGLDPDISPAYADLQAGRIAKARGASVDAVRKVIDAHVESPFLGFIGQPHVNVLMTNRALDEAIPKAHPKSA